MIKQTALFLALTALSLGVVSCGSNESAEKNVPDTRARTKAQARGEAPTTSAIPASFTVKDLDGNLHSSDEWIGKQPVVINFWGSWCGYCRKETPDLVKLYNEYQDKGVVILGLAINDTPAKAQAFAEQYHMDWPILMADNSVAAAFQIRGAPTTFFFDKDGNVVQVEDYNGTMVNKFVGARDYATLKRGFDAIL